MQSASVGVHLAEARELQPLPGAALPGSGTSTETRRNVLIVASVLVITASIIGGEKGLTLGALAGLVGLIAAVS